MHDYESRLREMAKNPRSVLAAAAVIVAFVLAMWVSAIVAALAVVPLALLAAFTASQETSVATQESARVSLSDGLNRHLGKGRRLSILDPRTALLQPWYLELRIADEARRCRRYGLRMAALFVKIRDDEALSADPDWSTEVEMDLVQLLARNLRAIDLAARTGEREFALCLPHTDEEGARSVAWRISQNAGSYSISLRLAAAPEDGIDYEGLYAKAQAFTPTEPVDAPRKPEQARLVEILKAEPSGEVTLDDGQSASSAKTKLRRASQQAGIDIRVWEQDGAVRFERLSTGRHGRSGAA